MDMNWKRTKYMIVVLTVLLVVGGCDSPETPTLSEKIDAGRVIDADIVPTSFNESIKITIKTDQGIFTVSGMASVMRGEEGTIDIYSDGSRYLCFSSWRFCRRLHN